MWSNQKRACNLSLVFVSTISIIALLQHTGQRTELERGPPASVVKELKQYDNILSLPKLGANGHLKGEHDAHSKLVKLDAHRAADAVNSYFNSLVKKVVAVPTGRQKLKAPPPSKHTASSSTPFLSTSPLPHTSLSPSDQKSAPKAIIADASEDAVKLKRELRSLSRAVRALKQSPREKASKNLEALRRKLQLLKSNVKAESSKWPEFGHMTLENTGVLTADGSQPVDTSHADPAAGVGRGRRGRVGGGEQASYPWSAHVDKANGQTYYWNRITNKSQWNQPAGWGLKGAKLTAALTAAQQAQEKCKKCLEHWSPSALRCVLHSCPRSAWDAAGEGALGNGKESRRQLELNNEIASLIHKCAGATSLSGRSGSGAALVDAGLLTRKQLEEALHVKVLVDTFVTPWDEGPHVHSWLVVRRASSGSGVRGLGVMSGATKVLAMGGHGDTLVSAKDALCHTSESLEQALKPLMRKQTAINAYRLKRFVNDNAPRHRNSYLDLPLRQGGGRAVSYPHAVEITWQHPGKIGAEDARQRADLQRKSTQHQSIWDQVWRLG